jgi:hypothetical protein
VQHNRIFSTEDSFHPDIVKMPQHLGWWPAGHPETIPQIARERAGTVSEAMQALPVGKRVVFLRWVLRYESYTDFGADPTLIFEQGGLRLARAISMLRPFGMELRRRGIHLDAVWTDNEGGSSTWQLTPEQIQGIYASSKARAKMPPGVKALRPEMFSWTHPNYRNAVVTFNRYATQLMCQSLRQVLVGAGIFVSPPSAGVAPRVPPTGNYNVYAPTWPVYDYNGWPIASFSLDGRTSSPSCYLSPGNRHNSGRVHDPRWNALADCINYVRSCMRRPGAVLWPTIAWPSYQHPWLFEQMIAHFNRTGVNTAGGGGYIYWRDVWVNAAVEDPLMVQIFNRHDQPFPVQRNLPEVQMDCDSITTGTYTTTYADFLANMP